MRFNASVVQREIKNWITSMHLATDSNGTYVFTFRFQDLAARHPGLVSTALEGVLAATAQAVLIHPRGLPSHTSPVQIH